MKQIKIINIIKQLFVIIKIQLIDLKQKSNKNKEYNLYLFLKKRENK
jgi:hypothetical protein